MTMSNSASYSFQDLPSKRIGKIQSVSQSISTLFNYMPQEVQDTQKYKKRIERIYSQFGRVSPKALLPFINAVYLNKDTQKDGDTTYKTSRKTFTYTLTVYVDNSIAAAEYNAQREIIVMKYKELFRITLSQFLIKTSKGKYRSEYPYRDNQAAPQIASNNDTTAIKQKNVSRETYNPFNSEPEPLHLTDDDIEVLVSSVSDPDLRASFKKTLMAQKRFQNQN